LHKISQAEVIPESFAPAAESRKDCFLFSCRLGLLLSGLQKQRLNTETSRLIKAWQSFLAFLYNLRQRFRKLYVEKPLLYLLVIPQQVVAHFSS
jgi:hypothetical protein